MSHQIAAVVLRLTAALFCMLAAVGCNNSPGSLVLRVTSVEAPTKGSEPIRVRATLEAVRGPVCLRKSAFMIWEVTPPGPDAKPIRSDHRMFRCGTGVAECLLMSPVLFPMSMLDVGDSWGRYDVMQTGDCREYDIAIHVGDLAAWPWPKESADRQAERTASPQCGRAASSQAKGSNSARTERADNAQAEERDAAWTPGEYAVVLRLRNEVLHGGGSILPPPLFWIPYNQAVDVSVKVQIAPATPNEDPAAANANG